MIVTNNPYGSAAGAEIFSAGGNAIDAAIASLFTLTVVEPMMVGIFGAGISTIRQADGKYSTINNYTTAPAAADASMYKTKSNHWPDYQSVENRANDIGPLSVGVPGSLKGWCETLEKFGTMSLEDVLQPAIKYATRGFKATGYLCEIARKFEVDLASDKATARTFLPKGKLLQFGDTVLQPEYADTLRLVAIQGADALYNGELGSIATDYLQKNGGIITQQDLRDYKTVSDDVIKGEYRGYDLIGPPPPTAGGVHIVEMLNILESFDLAGMGFGSVDSVHLLAEVLKIAFEDRKLYTGDPAFVDVPIEKLINKKYAAERRALINMSRTRPINTSYSGDSNHTTHVTAADADGNVIAATHTLNSAFGSKVTVPGTGMLLNNTMFIFDPHPGLANSIEPGKRVTSSMSPIIIEKQGNPVFALGCVGGPRIFPSVMQAIVNLIDHQMSPQQAVEAPRIWTLGEELEMEDQYSAGLQEQLRDRGHDISELKIIGGGMGMIKFEGEDLIGASCWRADGTPMGIAGGMARKGARFDI